MTAEPMPIDFVVDEDGRLRVSGDDAARLRSQLGHDLEPGATVHALVPAPTPKPFKPSYGVLKHLEPTLGKVDIAEVRREMTEELREAGKI